MKNKSQENTIEDIMNEPIAIVGMNCQFPGIDVDIEDVEAFHEMLVKGLTPIKEVPKNRWDIEAYYDADRKKADKVITRKGGFLSSPHLFDGAFFKISAIEAKQIDPQQRLFLEVSIRALNHANIRLDGLAYSNTAVYCGISTHHYSQLNYRDNIKLNAHTLLGVANSAATGRLSHFLNLRGPSMAVDTACSSSLSALYLAVMALRTQQCDMAIVGGVHLSLCPESDIGISKANILSATGQCSSFDSTADGFARSEGCGVVIVKRLSDALKDNNTIHGVIKSIVMNHDGDGVSLAAPSINAQIAMHQAVLENANIAPSDIDYIETHGTGTPVGDAVEFNAIQFIHQGHHSKDKPLIIGAVKSNIGHTISSSGVASLIKVISALKNDTIPPNLHYSTPNRLIDPESIPAVLPVMTTPYPKHKNKKRIAQVSNNGFSGVNVSLILEEPPEVVINLPRSDTSESICCFVVSAKSEVSLKQMLGRHAQYLKESSSSLHDICYTLINCRDHYKFRCAIIANDRNSLIQKIESEDYELKKVSINKDIKTIDNEANQIYEHYMSGINIQLACKSEAYNKIDLPLYFFDRKPYWHEPREKISNTDQPPLMQSLNVEPIAIIGMSCRLPGAPNIDAFLSLLEKGESGMVDIPIERWDNSKYYDPDVNTPGKLYIKQLGLIENIRNFDADFFDICPREARFMSPNVRILLETTYHALEHANLALDTIENSNTGVFIGCERNEYVQVLANQGLDINDFDLYLATGNAMSALAGRIGYAFNLNGPMQMVDSACSSSITAIHNACLSLQAFNCDMAIAGGVNILLRPESNVTLSKAKMLSPESRCKTFSEDADGYARSEGCGLVVLKRLSSAIKDNDNILAVIKGSSVNSDGRSAGFTVPNGQAQEAVIRSALMKSNLSPGDIDYIEAHGTGTPVADPIEAQTLMNIFSEHHSQDKPLYVSSVKTNIGHCESASGVASIIKVILSLQAQTLFKHRNFKKLNPKINFNNVVIPLENTAWRNDANLRYAGVNSFGFSGANAHVVIQQAPDEKRGGRTLPEEFLLVLSAKKLDALQLLLSSYQQYLSKTHDEFADICYTAATCRGHFLYRVSIKARSATEAVNIIQKNNYLISHGRREGNEASQRECVHPSTLDQLQVAYQDGIDINWVDFYKSLDTHFVKVILPLYEFAREEHWFADKGRLKDAPIPADWSFQLQWHPQPILHNNQKSQGNHWLLVGANPLQAGLEDCGLHIFLEADDYALDKLDGIIFAEGLEVTSLSDIDSNVEYQTKIVKKLLSLVRTLNKKSIQLQLVVLTRNAIAELVVGQLNINSSALIGYCKSLVLELPLYQTIIIDLGDGARQSSQQVVDEIKYNHGQFYEHIVAYRDGSRLVSRLKKSTMMANKASLIGQGRYLITGGLGGLGLVTAQALLSAGARELILISRNVNTEAIQAAVKDIETAYPGRVIRTIGIDITDKQALCHLFLDLNADGLLKGIIHAAGSALNAPFIEHRDEDIDYLFSAKVKGGWYLHELSQNCKLDFFIVYSSVASLFGSNNQSVYSATGSFLDALIAERHRLGLVGTAIQWGTWGEVGMLIKHSGRQDLNPMLINNGQGQALIKLLMNTKLRHVTIVSPKYLEFLLDFVPKPMPAFHQCLTSDLGGGKPETEIIANNLSPWVNSYFKMSDDKKRQASKDLIFSICKKIQERSTIEYLDEDDGFYDLGFDSLMITELAYDLKDILEPFIKVTVSIGFDYPTINKLANYIKQELDNQFSKQHVEKSLSAFAVDSIAIIGMSCSLPNAPDLESFETLLEEGLSGIKDVPIDRWDNSSYYSSNRNDPNKIYVNKHGLMDDIKSFDARFFGISPREAKMMDPQQRIFLQCCYHALENANYTPGFLSDSLTGVFAGVSANEYHSQLEQSNSDHKEQSVFAITGNVINLVSGRVAYAFDFKGPSISVDTACSSSLVAIHYACQSLKNREVDYALAGGVNVLIRPESNVMLCRSNALSPDGQCKTFDKAADGFARSEGCGVIFLKRTSDAIRDKDNILAVIKASAVNNDGKSAGITVPNGKSQEDVMRKALSQSELSTHDISFIEAHGTGTLLGDPIEVHAINRVYGSQRNLDNPLYLSAVKTNIGHLESASGVASIIKTVISLKNKKIYKHLNFKELNPNIQIDATRIALQNTDWVSDSKPRTAGVNAFGFSGTNAHVILQEFPSDVAKRTCSAPSLRAATVKLIKPHLLVISAKSKTALDNLASRYQHYLATTPHDFGDICFTAATSRDHYAYRLALVAEGTVEACRLLANGQFAISSGKNNVTVQSSSLLDYIQGQSIDWLLHYKNMGGEFIKVELPNYPFERIAFWPDKKSDHSARKDTTCPSQFISYNPTLQHLYHTTWQNLSIQPPGNTDLPEFLVIAANQEKAKIHLGNLQYQFINNLNSVENIENKNIIYFYEQGQFNALFHCCQTMFKLCPGRFILVTENAYAVHDKDSVNPYHTMASAFWKSFKNELVFHKNYTIDIDENSHLMAILNEIYSDHCVEDQFAIRDSIYIPRLTNLPLSIQLAEQEISFASDATYLIVGGTGGLAGPLIEYLMHRNAKHIILVSRSECSINTNALIDNAALRQVCIRHHQADASNYQQMEAIIEAIGQSSHPLKGVFHLAGVAQNGLITTLTDDEIQSVLSAKMDSALILHQLTQNISLEHFVLYSSSSSLLGGQGQSNYVAANGFLDGLAHLRRRLGKPAIAINWGPFHSVGMGAHLTQTLKHQGFLPLDKGCIDILDALLKCNLAQISPCSMDWDLYFKHSPKQKWLSCMIQDAPPSGQHFFNALQQRSLEERITLLSQALREITADVLALDDIEKITVNDSLFSMGMDSLMALEIRHRIYDKLQCAALSLSIEYFINAPSIDKIARDIAAELQNIVDHPTVNYSPEVLEEIALCDFQYFFWVLDKLGFGTNVGLQLRLNGKLNKDHVFQAFDFVVHNNSAFWLHFNQDAPLQTLQRQGKFKFLYKDLSLSTAANVPDNEFKKNILRDIPLTQQPLIQVYLYKINPSLHELHIVIPHIIVDETSCAMVFSQFKNAYEALTLGTKLIQKVETNSFLHYVQQNNRHYEKNIAEKINFWRTYNNGFKMLQFSPKYHLPDAAVYQTKHLFHYILPSPFVKSFIDWHQVNNMNVSTGLIAICQIVLYKMSRQSKIPITLLHSGREGSQYKSVIGLFTEYKRINISFNENYTWIDCIRAIEEQLVKSAAYQKCSLPIKDSGLRGNGLTKGQHVSLMFNKLFRSKYFKKSKLHTKVMDYYLELYSRIEAKHIHTLIKYKLNKLFDLKLALQKPAHLNVLIGITSSFFGKKNENMNFADLNYTYPSHFGSLDRPIGNQALWIYFTKNQQGEYQLSINGPLTIDGKEKIALEFNKVLSKFVESDEYTILDL